MGAYDGAVSGKHLLEDDQLLAGKLGGVDGEGHLDGAGGGLRRELDRARDGVAFGIGHGLTGLLVHDRPFDGVDLARIETAVGNGIGQRHVLAYENVLVSVGRRCRGPDLGRGNLDGLALVVDVLVGAYDGAVSGKHLLEDDQFLAGKLGGVDGEGHLDGAIVTLGRELGAHAHLVAVGVGENAVVNGVAVVVKAAHVHGSLDGVGLARIEAAVGNGVGQGHALAHGELLAVRAGGRSANLGGADLNGLALVVDVLMRGDQIALRVVKLLEHHDVVTCDAGGVERELDLLLAGDLHGRELDRARDGVAVGVGHGLAGLLVHKGADKLIGVAGGQALIGNRIRDGGGLADADVLATVDGSGGGADGEVVVIDRATIDHMVVAADRDVEGNEVEVLVGRNPKLLEGVGVVRKRTEGVIGGRGAVRATVEPHAGGVVEQALVNGVGSVVVPRYGGVVGVGLARVGVPVGGGGNLAVGVGHDHMALAGRLARHEERDARKAVHVESVHLDELDVAANDLIVHGVLKPREIDHLPVVADLKGLGPIAVEKVSFGCHDLGRGVGAVRQRVIGSRAFAVLIGRKVHHDLARIVAHAADEHGVLAVVGNSNARAFKGGSAERQRLVEFAIHLAKLNAAAPNLVVLVARPLADVAIAVHNVDVAIGGDDSAAVSDAHHIYVVGDEVAGRCCGLADDNRADGQGLDAVGVIEIVAQRADEVIGSKRGVTVLVGLNDPRTVGLVADEVAFGVHDGLAGAVDDRAVIGLVVGVAREEPVGVLRARKRGVALGDALAGLGVNLLDPQARRVVQWRLGHGSAVHNGVLTGAYLDGVGVGIERVPGGGRNLLHVVGADLKVARLRSAAAVSRHGLDERSAAGIAVDAVDSVGEAVRAVAVGDRSIARDLLDRHGTGKDRRPDFGVHPLRRIAGDKIVPGKRRCRRVGVNENGVCAVPVRRRREVVRAIAGGNVGIMERIADKRLIAEGGDRLPVRHQNGCAENIAGFGCVRGVPSGGKLARSRNRTVIMEDCGASVRESDRCVAGSRVCDSGSKRADERRERHHERSDERRCLANEPIHLLPARLVEQFVLEDLHAQLLFHFSSQESLLYMHQTFAWVVFPPTTAGTSNLEGPEL